MASGPDIYAVIGAVGGAIGAVSGVAAVCVALMANGTSNRNHSKLVKRDEFQPYREALAKSRLELVELNAELDRAVDPTVDIASIRTAFDVSHRKLDGIQRAMLGALGAIEESGLFGDSWVLAADYPWQDCMVEVDCVLDDQRPEADRRAAGRRAVTILTTLNADLIARVKTVIQATA